MLKLIKLPLTLLKLFSFYEDKFDDLVLTSKI